MAHTTESIDTLIISDVHLGSEVSRAKELLQMMKRYSFLRLVILGDLFDNLNFKRLRDEHWELLSYLRQLPGEGKEVVWVLGNHDGRLKRFAGFLGVAACQDYTWSIGGKNYFALHGHQFDGPLRSNRMFGACANNFYTSIQLFGGKKQRFARLIKKISKGSLRLSKRVAKNAVQLAEKKNAQFAFCGHTHNPISVEKSGIRYMNTGSWTMIPSYYIVIPKNGEPELRTEA